MSKIMDGSLENERDTWQKAIAEEQAKGEELAHWYKSILDATPFPISVTDADMNWTFVNKAVEKFLGKDREELLGRQCGNWNTHICNTEECGITCAKKGLKHTYFSHEGESYQVDVEILKNINRETVGYIEVVQNVTQISAMEKEKAEAQAANYAKSAFLARMSHEIRTPLNAIMGITEIQMQDESLPDETREALGKIYNSGDLLLNIINDILDLSKIEAGKLELAPIRYEIASLINDAAQMNIMQYESKPIEFRLHVDENTPSHLCGDEVRIRQALNNLLSNAFKYTDSGKVVLSVSAEASKDKPDEVILVFTVSDTGHGMTREQLDTLFDDYTRFHLETNRTATGTGLGMSITKNLVDMMNGELSAESEPDRGSVFTMKLPQKSVGADKMGRELAENLAKFRFNGLAQINKMQVIRELMPYGSVLIVDDVETNLYVAKLLMQPYGLSIETASSGFEALDKIRKNNIYDIVFMDHMMPKMDGIEATQLIRGLGYKHPVVALTANALAGQAEIFLGNGFDAFISKPVDIRQLNAVLNQFIRDKQPQEVLESVRLEMMMSRNNGKAAVPKIETAAEPDPQIINIFTGDAKKAAAVLEEFLDKSNNIDKEDIKLYTVNVHAMKSALALIGEKELSGVALELEKAGREQNAEYIAGKTPAFLEKLRALIEKFTPAQSSPASPGDLPGEDNGGETDDTQFLCEKLFELQTACAMRDKNTAEFLIIQLENKTRDGGIKEQLESISRHIAGGGFDEAVETAEKIIRMVL